MEKKCKHEWKNFGKYNDDTEEFYCTKCLAWAKVRVDMIKRIRELEIVEVNKIFQEDSA